MEYIWSIYGLYMEYSSQILALSKELQMDLEAKIVGKLYFVVAQIDLRWGRIWVKKLYLPG